MAEGKSGKQSPGNYGRALTFATVEAPEASGQEWIGDKDALARCGQARSGRHRFDDIIDEERNRLQF